MRENDEKIQAVNVIKDQAKLNDSSVNALVSSIDNSENFKSELVKTFKGTPVPDYKKQGQEPSLSIQRGSTDRKNLLNGCYETLICYTNWGKFNLGGDF